MARHYAVMEVDTVELLNPTNPRVDLIKYECTYFAISLQLFL